MPALIGSRRALLHAPIVATSAFNPLTPPVTSGLVLQLDANQGTSTTVNGASMASWTDAVGGNVFSQGTGATQPTYTAVGQNGRPVIAFSGSQYLVAAGVISALNGSAFTICWVGAANNTTGAKRLFSNDDTAGFKGFGCGTQGSAHNGYWGTGTTTTNLGGPANGVTAYHAVALSIDPTRTVTVNEAEYYYDSSTASNSANLAFSAQSTITPAVGTQASSLNSANWNGKIAEILVYNRCLTTTEIASVLGTSYFKTKWGTP